MVRNAPKADALIANTLQSAAIPVSMAALTTFSAGATLLGAITLAYNQMGWFIVILACASLILALFYFPSVYLLGLKLIELCRKRKAINVDESISHNNL